MALSAEDFSRLHHRPPPRHHHDNHSHHSMTSVKHTRAPESCQHPFAETTTSSQTSPVERVAHTYQPEMSHSDEDLATCHHGSTSPTPAKDAGKEGSTQGTCLEDSPDVQDGSERDMRSESGCHVDCKEPSDPRALESPENVTRQETEPHTPEQSAQNAGV